MAKSQFNLPGIDVFTLNQSVDERGSFCEVLRADWESFFRNDKISQINLSISHPGTIRAWHRHSKNQIDYLLVLEGSMKIAAYDDNPSSKTFQLMDEIILSSAIPTLARVPGNYWHGTKTLGQSQSKVLYFINNLYDYSKPDEERRPWNDPSIIDGRTGQPFDWNRLPFK